MMPRGLLLLLVAIGVPVLGAGAVMPPLRELSLFINLMIGLVALFDWLTSPRLSQLSVTREVLPVLSVGARNPVDLHVRNTSSQPMTVELFDEHPQPASLDGLPLTLTVPAGKVRSARYHLQPHRRGRDEFAAVHLRTVSRLGLWALYERRPIATPVRIYPDIRAVYRYELLARRNRLDELGLKLHRLRGRGSDFERLREYRRGDEHRQIDWKATSRHQQLISREFNVERNQNVLVLLDCGRSMLNESDGLSYLDRGLNAAIMLSYIALGQGDNVGFMAFSSRIERAVKPVRAKAAIQSIIQHTFDLEARREASDYPLAFEQVARKFRKRSLVILITHVVDEQHLESISRPLRHLRSPHLFLCVFLKDLGLTQLADRIPNSDVDAFQNAAAAELLTATARGAATLKDRGVLVLDTLPDQLTAAIINEYLDIKARHLM